MRAPWSIRRTRRSTLLLLIQWAPGGNSTAQERLELLLGERIEKSQVLRHRVDIKHSLSELDQVRYYSAWYYAAVHILLAIP